MMVIRRFCNEENDECLPNPSSNGGFKNANACMSLRGREGDLYDGNVYYQVTSEQQIKEEIKPSHQRG